MKNELVGQVFGYLTLIKKHNTLTYKSGATVNIYEFLCVCGNKVYRRLRRSKSTENSHCGCKRHDLHGLKKHGQTETRLYTIWINMKQRCYNKNVKSYKNYGGRGIEICKEWINNFDLFYLWAMSNGYNDKLEIERINVNGNYEPSNCKWATILDQANNRRSNIYYEWNGEKLTLAQIAKLTSLPMKKLWYRINRQEMSLIDAVNMGNKRKGGKHKNSMLLRCEILGVPYNAVKLRKHTYKITEEEAIAYYLNKK